jgi:cytochrome c-type protein NapC
MGGNGSRECRNCHDFDAMSQAVQKQSVYTKHMAAQKEGKTCIDCHKGIAHHLPKEYRDPEEEGMATPASPQPAG